MSYKSVLVLLSCFGIIVVAATSSDACPSREEGPCRIARISQIGAIPLATAAPIRHRPPMSLEVPGELGLIVRTFGFPMEAQVRTDKAPNLEMPWIWKMLKKEVYNRLPRYEQGTAQRKKFTAVLSPVVVDSGYDTVPGVGVEGDF